MNQKRFSLICLVLTIILTIVSFCPLQVQAATATTVTSYSTTSDGYLWTMGSNYADAWGASAGSTVDVSTLMTGGQILTPANFQIYRSFLFFDTTSIPTYANITSAVLSLYVTDAQGTNYSIQIQTGGSIYPHNPLQSTDYYQGRYSGNGGSSDVNTISGIGYWNISLSTTGLTYITPTGITRLTLRSTNDINQISTGTGDEYVSFYARDKGQAYAPKLIVTYTVADGAVNYLIHGPYYEDGTTATATVTCTLYQRYGATLTHTFNGTSGSAETWNLSLVQPALYLKWNITSSYNYTRFYYFNNQVFDEVWLYIPHPSDILQQYSINTILLGQLTNAYTSTLENIDGTNHIIERQPSDAINSLPFFLTMYNQYSLQVSSDQGTWTFNLPADTLQTKTYTITADMITENSNLYQFTVRTQRINGTAISFFYNDPSGETISVTTVIQHYTLNNLVTDYTQTDLGNTQSFLMPNATGSTSYIANVTAIRNNDVQTWQQPIPAMPADQFWNHAFDSLGTWPIPAYQLPAIAICIFFFGIGNWKDSETICFIVIIICGVLQVIGWGYFPTPGIVMAGMVVVFAYLHRGKQESAIIES